MTPKRKLLLKTVVAVVLIACVAGVIVIRSTRFQIAYHDWQMKQAWNETWTKPTYENEGIAGYSLGRSYERYKYHRQQLIDIGVISEIEYQFRHIQTQTIESRHFIDQLMLNCPNSIDWVSPSPNDPKPLELTIWCYSQDEGSWIRFIAEHDVPDYESQFMDENETERATQ